MERRKFIKGIAAILGMIAVPVSLLNGQEMVKKQRNLLSRRERSMYPLTAEEAFRPQQWKLIFDGELPITIDIELQHSKGGSGWTIHDTRQPGMCAPATGGAISMALPFNRPYKIIINPSIVKEEIHTIVLSYKYKGEEKWRYVYISAKNFHEKNDYTFEIELLEKGNKFDQTYIGHDPVSGSYSITIIRMPGIDSMIKT